MREVLGTVRGRMLFLATLCLLTGVGSVVANLITAPLLSTAQTVARQQANASVILGRIDKSTSELVIDSLLHNITHGSDDVKAKTVADNAALDAFLAQLKAVPMPTEQADRVAEVEKDIDAWRAYNDSTIADPPTTQEANATAAAEGKVLSDAITTSVTAAQTDFQSLFDAEQERARVLSAAMGYLSVALGLGGGVGIAVFLFLLTRAMRRRIDVMVQTLGRLQTGDLAVRCALTGHDEFAQMGGSVDGALASLAETMTSIDATGVEVRQAAESLRTVSQKAAVSAEVASERAGSVADSAGTVSRTVSSVAASSEEMGSSIQEISRNAVKAVTVATRAVSTVQETTTSMSKLSESSREIGDVVRLITSIAEQTNLLALNATIEAARAGDAGKGFAVVADEVKQLAQETARATEDISRRVETIQSDAEQAVDAIGEIAEVITQINEYQTTISSAVEEQSAATADINQGVSLASSGTSDIAETIAGLAASTREVAGAVDHALVSAAALDTMSTQMTTLLAKFRY